MQTAEKTKKFIKKVSPFSEMLVESPLPKYLKTSFNNDKHKKFFSVKASMKFEEEDEAIPEEDDLIASGKTITEMQVELLLYFKVNYCKLNKEEGTLKFTVDITQNCGSNITYEALYEGIVYFDKYCHWKVSGVSLRPVLEKSAPSILKWMDDESFTSATSTVRTYVKDKEGKKTFSDKVFTNLSIEKLMKRAIISRLVKSHYEAKK